MIRSGLHRVNYLARHYLSMVMYGLTIMVMPNRFYTMRYPGGIIRLPLCDSFRMWAKILGSYEYNKTRFIREHLKTGRIVIDVGANVGYYTWLFASKVGSKGHIYAIEPEPRLFWELQQTLKISNLSNVTLIQCALGSKHDKATFYYGKFSGWGSLYYSEDHAKHINSTIEVEIKTIDQLVKENSIQKVDLLKIDVEDGDFEVLKGAENTLIRYEPDIVIDVDFRDAKLKKRIWDYLKFRDYNIFSLEHELIELHQLQENLKDIFASKKLIKKDI